jgi:hypothetical protein
VNRVANLSIHDCSDTQAIEGMLRLDMFVEEMLSFRRLGLAGRQLFSIQSFRKPLDSCCKRRVL